LGVTAAYDRLAKATTQIAVRNTHAFQFFTGSSMLQELQPLVF
jgi:hypothetical protein